MEIRKLTLLLVVCFILSVFSVTAVVDLEIQQSSIDLEGEPGDTVSGSFTLENTGNESITVTFTENDLEKGSEQIDINDIPSETLTPGETETVSFSIPINNGQESGTYTGSIEAVSGSASDSVTIDLLVNATGGLEFEDLDVSITTLPRHDDDSDRETDNDLQDGDRIDFEDADINPGSELQFRFDIENTFSTDSENDMTDVQVTVTIVDIDDGDDIEEESDKFEIDAGKSKPIDIFLTLPIEVEQEEFDIEILVEGDGDDDETYTNRMDLTISIDKESRDIILHDLSVFPDSISRCPGNTNVRGTVRNIGAREEDEVAIEVTNSQLGLSFRRSNIDLEEVPFDDDNEFTFSVPVSVPNTVRAQSYPIKVNAFLEEGLLWDSRTLTFKVDSCNTVTQEAPEEEEEEEKSVEEETPQEEEEPEETGEEEETTTIQGTDNTEDEEQTETTRVPVLKPAATTETSTTQGPLFWIFLILFNVVIISVIVFAITRLHKK